LAIEQHGATPALAGVAPHVGARELELIAQHIGEQSARFDREALRLPVDVELYVHGRVS
jgi:hypothetical protein